MTNNPSEKPQAKNGFGINISVRLKNPWFWFGIVGVVLTSMNITDQNCNTWGDLFNLLIMSVQNPFKVGSAIVAIIGVIVDPTTIGIGDSTKALSYISPKR